MTEQLHRISSTHPEIKFSCLMCVLTYFRYLSILIIETLPNALNHAATLNCEKRMMFYPRPDDRSGTLDKACKKHQHSILIIS